MKRTVCLAVIFVASVLMGCATAPKEWVSNPVSRTAENDTFKARLEPGKEGKRTFISFRLILTNKTGNPMEVDWNQTRYLLNGKPNGVFWFKGIDPRKIKGNIPPDIIPGGSRFEKMIFPVKLVAFAPVQDDTLRDGAPGIYPGPMPQGKNGVHLVVSLNGKRITEKLEFSIVAESIGPS